MYTLKNYKDLLNLCLKAENEKAPVPENPEAQGTQPPEGPVGKSGNKATDLRNEATDLKNEAIGLGDIGARGGPSLLENKGDSIEVGFQLNEDGNPVLDSETVQKMRDNGEGQLINIFVPKLKEGEQEQSYGLEEILPPDVSSITIIDQDGNERTLERREGSLTGEFVDPNDSDFTLEHIDSDTSVKISGIRTEEELAELEQKANDSMETFLREHPEYEDNPEMKAIAMDLIRKSNLEGNPIDINEMLPRVLTGDFSNYEGLSDGGAGMKSAVRGMQDRLDGSRGGGLGGKTNLDLGGDGLPVGAEISDGLKDLVKLAISQIGITERDGGADKYLDGKSSKQIPWCAAFANWCLQQSGLPGTGSLVAESFVGGGNPGKHVGMYIENNGNPCILGGNQSNEVRVSKVKQESIIGYYNPIGNPKISTPPKTPIPSGVFIVTGGGRKTR